MFRPAIEKMAPYVPGEQPRADERVIKLNTNENPYPPSPRVRAAIARALEGGLLRRYPPPRADEFIAQAARFYKLPEAMILAGNGSDELLAMLFRAALSRGDAVTWAAPTYSFYDTLAAIQQARVIAHRYPRDFTLPLDALANSRARLTIVCNPNSPSGTLTAPDVLDKLARRLDGRLLAIDEAYVDFADTNALGILRRNRNVMILRTLSKSYSLAGMRLGLCFAHPEVIETLLKVKDSYNLNRLAVAAGAAALRDAAWADRNIARVRRTRARTESKLRAMGFDVPQSQANFVLARLAGRDLGPLAAALRRRGILVRHFATPALADALRISIGTPDEMRALFAALASLVRRLVSARANGAR